MLPVSHIKLLLSLQFAAKKMSAANKTYRIKRPNTATKREHTKENFKQPSDQNLLEGSSEASETLIQRQPEAASTSTHFHQQSFGSCSNINQSSRRQRFKSTNRLATGSNTVLNSEKSEPEIAVVFESEDEVMRALMERSRCINEWLLNGQLCMKMFR